MKISIAMATYNGAKYIQEQLESFSNQTLLPDELIVCDDGSTDQTLEIIDNFSRTAAFSVNIYKNENRLGFAANFGRAMSLCSGDIVFLSDQDDYWFHNKIEAIAEIFKKNKDAWLVINDAEITDSTLKPTGMSIIGQINSAKLSINNHINGCCSAYKKNINKILLPIPDWTIGHDSWLHQISSLFGLRVITNKQLQYYRRHNNNTSTHITSSTSSISYFKRFKSTIFSDNLRIKPIKSCDIRIFQLGYLRRRLETNSDFLLKNLPSPSVFSTTLLNIDAMISANENRKLILAKRLPSRLIAAIHFYRTGGYQPFEGFKSFAKDVLR